MRCAVVDTETLLVVNMIEADAAIDPPPGNTFLVNTDGPCRIGWIYDAILNDFTDPNPQPEPEPVPEPEQTLEGQNGDAEPG